MKGSDAEISSFWNALKGMASERLASPLLFSFAFSWLLVNFRLLLIITADEAVVYKLQMIEGYFQDFGWLFLFAYPFLASLFYVFLYPFIARPINQFVLKKQLQMKNDKDLIEGQQIVTEERLRTIQTRFYEQKQHMREEIEKLTNEAEEYRVRLQNKSEFKAELDDEIMPTYKKPVHIKRGLSLSNEELKIIQLLGEWENVSRERITEKEILRAFDKSKVSAKLALENLDDIGFISTFYFDNGRIYELTKEGREVFINLPTEAQKSIPSPLKNT